MRAATSPKPELIRKESSENTIKEEGRKPVEPSTLIPFIKSCRFEDPTKEYIALTVLTQQYKYCSNFKGSVIYNWRFMQITIVEFQ